MNIEDKIFFEQRFKGIGISEEELLLYLNCLRHSREISNSSDILMCRFDKKIEINFSLGYDDNGSSKTIGGFISKDDNSVLFDCEKYDYDTNKSIKYIEEFIFENSSIKSSTECVLHIITAKLASVSISFLFAFFTTCISPSDLI